MALKKPFGRTTGNPKAKADALPVWRRRVLELAAKARASKPRLLSIDEINEQVASIRGR